MADMLIDLSLDQLWEIAQNLGVQGKQITDKQYLVKVIKQRRAGLAREEATALTDAHLAAAAKGVNSERVQPMDLVDRSGDAPDYKGMDTDDLRTLAEQKGLTIIGSGKDGAVLKGDYIKALKGE